VSDELERLENALRTNTPHPPAEARQRAVIAATAEFDRHRQEIRGTARQKGQVSKIGAFWSLTWLRRFAVPTSRPALVPYGPCHPDRCRRRAAATLPRSAYPQLPCLAAG